MAVFFTVTCNIINTNTALFIVKMERKGKLYCYMLRRWIHQRVDSFFFTFDSIIPSFISNFHANYVQQIVYTLICSGKFYYLEGPYIESPIIMCLAALSHSVQHIAIVLSAFAVAMVFNLYARIRPLIGFLDMITGLLFFAPGSVGVALSVNTLTSKKHPNELSITVKAGQQGMIFATHIMITVAVSFGLVLAAVIFYLARKVADYGRKMPRYKRRNWVGEITI